MGIKESIWGALGIKAAEVPKEVLLTIRDGMLEDLGRYDTTSHPALFMKIFYADDIDKFWNLRTDLLAALKELYGEERAMQRMDSITTLFVGHHPAAKKKRPFLSTH